MPHSVFIQVQERWSYKALIMNELKDIEELVSDSVQVVDENFLSDVGDDHSACGAERD